MEGARLTTEASRLADGTVATGSGLGVLAEAV